MTPQQKIKRAALNNTGVRLTADECFNLYFGDEAIKSCADNDDGWDGSTVGTYAEQRRAHSASNNGPGEQNG